MILAQLSSPPDPSFWREALQTLSLRAGYNTTVVVLGTTLLGFAAGLVGSFLLLRKRSLVADALSHATLPGVALAFLIADAIGNGLSAKSLPVLLLGAAITGVLAVLTVQLIVRHTRLREDAAIGLTLSVYFGVGVVLLRAAPDYASTPASGLHHFIYGQTAGLLITDVYLMGAIATIAILAAAFLFKELALTCFNDDFARATGWPVSILDIALMGLVVLVVVAGLQAVGLILVVALLIIPPAAARFWTERLARMVLVSALIGGASGYAGSTLSALLPRQPTGAIIVLVAGALFIISMLAAPSRGVIPTLIRRARLRARFATDHLVEFLFDTASPASLSEVARDRAWSSLQSRIIATGARTAGLITGPTSALALTDAGRARGHRVARNHALWSQYLVTYADLAPSHVDFSVDQVEHILSEDLIAELEQALARRGIKSISAQTSSGGDA